MKKILLCVSLICVMFCLNSCTLLRISTIKADGKDLNALYKIVSGGAKRVDLIGIAYTVITTEKMTKEFLNNLPAVLIKVDKDNKVKSIGIETNFTHKE